MSKYASYPGPSFDNPFQIPWALAMEDHGWHVLTPVWWPGSLFRNCGRIPIILFHWPESYWRSEQLWRSYLKAAKFLIMVRLAKLLGYKLVWSAHNVMPHEYLSESLERKMRLWILSHFDLILGHAHNTLEDLQAEFGEFHLPYAEAVLGHYEGLYNPSADRETLLKKWDLSPSKHKVLLMLSGKKYKDQANFLEAWSSGRWDHLQLILAGRVPPSLRQAIENLPGDVRHLGNNGTPHNMLSDLMLCTDMLALSYRRITTSSAYFLAVTFFKPVLAPDLPFFLRHSREGSALLYRADQGSAGIAAALRKLDSSEWQVDHQALQELRSQYTWAKSSACVADAFDRLLGK